MKNKTAGMLWDIQRTANFVIESTANSSPEQISVNILLRSAIGLQLEIAGEAGRRLADYDHEIASSLPSLRETFGTRNLIAHQYDRFDWARIFETINGPIANLALAISFMLQGIQLPEGEN